TLGTAGKRTKRRADRRGVAVDPSAHRSGARDGLLRFGNVRSCRSSQDGQLRPGDNLFGNSLVALDLKTGAYKWHFQSIRHDHWDMDNTSPPPLADLTINGQTKKVIYYGAKVPMTFIIDRTNGQPIAPIVDRPRVTDS